MNKPKIRFNEFENIWTKSKLGELYEVYSGNTPSRSDDRNYQNGEIPWIKTTDLNNSIICSNEENISVYGATRLKVLPEKSVLIAMYGGFNQIGRTGLLAYPATINQALAALMPVNEINPNFLLNFLNFKKESWRNVAASSRKDPNITKNDVEKFKISFPSLDEQSTIGSLFRTLDDLLASYKDNLANYQSLKATMLSKMFSKAGQTVPEIRLDGFEGEWEEKYIGELADIVRGASPRPIQDPKWFDTNSEIGWLRISDVTSQNGRIYSLEQKISKLGQEKTRVLTEPHLLLSIAATVGKPVVNYVKTGVHDGFLIFMNPKFDREFMFQWLEMFREKWNRYGQPGSQVNLNSDIVKNQKILIPSMEEQQAIGTYFSNLDNLISAHQEKISQLETLKKKLLQDMFI